MQSSPASATSSLLGPNFLLSTLFSDALNLCYSLSIRNQVTHPYKTTGKITILDSYNLLCLIPDSYNYDGPFWLNL
jgi:hypothetical protein